MTLPVPSPRTVRIGLGIVLAAALVEGTPLVRAALGLAGQSEWVETARAVGAVVGAALAFLLGVDLLRALRLPLPEMRRELPRSIALREWADVALVFDRSPARLGSLEVIDHVPEEMETRGMPVSVRVSPGAPVRVQYRVRALRRGDAAWAPAHVRVASPLGLWRAVRRIGGVDTRPVYPNYRAVFRYGLIETEHETPRVGIHLRPRRGVGREFHQLREYRLGDSQRQIDWKATSRKQALISREYQDERDQRVVFLLDSGRRMRARDGELSHFDHCLDALLLLAWVALRGGDAVGLLAFGSVSRWLPPSKGPATMSRILGGVYDLDATSGAADYRVAAETLARRLDRRALVVLLTHLALEDVDDLLPAVAQLRRRHLVLVASLRESAVDAVIERVPSDADEALELIGALSHEVDRDRVRQSLQARGVSVADVLPRALAPALINHYYAIKRGGLL